MKHLKKCKKKCLEPTHGVCVDQKADLDCSTACSVIPGNGLLTVPVLWTMNGGRERMTHCSAGGGEKVE